MTIVLRVVEKGSFSAASRELGIPLATVSRKVNELETHLGIRLLVRTTRKVGLTDAGAAYVASARRILEEIDETERIAAGEFHAPRGELVLTAPVLFGRLYILPVVTDFLAAYPEINIRLLLLDRNLHLLDDHIDMAARIGPLPDSGMVATRIGSMRTVVVRQSEAARGARHSQISGGFGFAAVRELRISIARLRLVVPVEGGEGGRRRVDPAATLRVHHRGGCLGCDPGRRRDQSAALSMC